MVRGRKFDTFEFHINGQRVDVPVRVEKDDYGQIKFSAQVDGVGVFVDADVNALRDKIKGELAEYLTIDWSLWLQIRINEPGYGDRVGFSVGYDFFALGVQKSGKEVCVKVESPVFPLTGNDVWDGTWVAKEAVRNRGVIAGRPTVHSRSVHDETVSLVPATIQNVEALRALLRAVEALRGRLDTLLSPEQAEKTLQSVPVTKLLQAV